MQDSFSELFKLLFLGIIVQYLELTSYNKGADAPLIFTKSQRVKETKGINP